ncbi:MAG TPA: efflux RND transporter permease subunit [Alphaproteobacteria bacterium]
MGISETCIRRPVMTSLVMAAFVIFGSFAYRLLPVAALPRVDFPTIQVTAQLAGASPETMASSVAAPLERQFATIAGISQMTSQSGLGVTQITIQFDLDRSIDGAALDVQAAMTTAARKLPPEMIIPPGFQKVNPADQPILFLILSSSIQPLSVVDEYAEVTVAQRISMLRGVAQVQVYGAQKFAVRIQVDPEALTTRGISIDEIKTAVASANSSTPVGAMNGDKQNFTIQASGSLTRAAQYKPLIIAYRNGAPVRLGDVATVIDSVENNKVAGWLNGDRSIVLGILRQPDANTVQVVDSVKALLPQFRALVPASIDLNVLNDRSDSIRSSIADVQFTLAIAVVLVVFVIYLFLRNAIATAIPALALPVSLVGTFAGMYMLGYSIDNMSLLAMTLSVGFVVDDAIVMLENIVRYLEQGMKPMEAAFKGSKEIGFTIISITLSLVAVFIPVLFMGGVVGRVFREFAMTISMTILISGIVSLTLTPMLCSRVLKPLKHGAEQNFILRLSEAGFEALLRGYELGLKWVLAHRLPVLAFTFVTIFASVFMYHVVPKGFFPIEDTGFIYGVTEGAQDTSFAAMVERQKAVSDIVKADPDVDYVTSTTGAILSRPFLNTGSVFIALKPLDQRKASVIDVIQRLRRSVSRVPGINVFFQPVQNIQLGGRLAKSQYQYTVLSSDFQELYRVAPTLEGRIRQLPGFQDVTSDLQIATRQASIDIDRDKASQLNVAADQIRSTLYSAFGTRQISTIYTPSNDYQVIIEADPRYQSDPTQLNRIYVRSSTGQLVPIESFTRIRQTNGPLGVNHQSQVPSVTISFNLAPGFSLGEAVDRIKQLENEVGVPATVSTGFQGTAQVFQDSLKGQGLLIIAAVLVIYIVLGILYESYAHPVTILSGLPTAGFGAIVMLMLFGMELTVIAVIGIVMLIGIVKKNAIMMVDFAIERRHRGMSPPEAIFEACLLRFRPIMMTTMAAIFGTLPIAFGVGAGSELRRPLGIAVVGGLLFSQALTLFITPVVYIYVEQMRERLGRRRKRRAQDTTQVAE